MCRYALLCEFYRYLYESVKFRVDKLAANGVIFIVAIIGTGGIAHSHADAYKKMDDVEMVAAADLVPGKAAAFMKKFGWDDAHIYENHLELLENEELDAVSICTYNAQHMRCTIDALDRGVNVLVEKPMSVTLDEAVEMCRAEKRSGKILTIGFQPRFEKNMQYIKKIVQSGELGDVYYIQTGGGRRRGIPGGTFIEKTTGGIGAVGDIGCYSLDMVLNAVGYPKPLTVTGYTSDFFGKNPEVVGEEDAKRFNVDDFAAAFIRMEGGLIIDFRISWAMNMDYTCSTLFFGKKAGLRVPATDCWNGEVGGAMRLYKTVEGADTVTWLPVLDCGGWGDLFYRKTRTFLDAIRDGKPAPVPSSQILYNQAIIDGIVRSAELGREVDIVIPEI